MNKLAIAVLALCAWIAVSAFAQDNSSSQQSSTGSSAQSGGTEQSTTSTTTTTETTHTSDKSAAKAKLHHIRGTIGQDGKTFTADKDNKSWTIVNPDAVQGHEGHHVILSAHVYPDKDQVHVMGVKMAGEKSSKSSSDTSTGGQQPPQQ
jgi:hypothetical protein